MKRRERWERFEQSRDIEAMPIFGRMSRILGPRPVLQPGERRLMNASATRTTERRSNFITFVTFGLARRIRSQGRLVLTDRRLIYTTGRDPATFGLAKQPESLGNIDIPLASVRKVRSNRQGWSIAGYFEGRLPGSVSLSIELHDVGAMRFENVYGRWWDTATEEIASQFPRLKREQNDD